MRKTLCSACGKYFTSTEEFDNHRTGQYGKDRRCRTTEEMVQIGYTGEQHVITDEIGRPARVVWSKSRSRLGKKFLQALDAV